LNLSWAVSPCGWLMVPGAGENVLPTVPQLEIGDLYGWSTWLRHAYLNAFRRRPSLMVQAADLLLERLERAAHQTPIRALKAGALEAPLRLVSAAISLSLCATDPDRTVFHRPPLARPKLSEKVRLLDASEVTVKQAEPWRGVRPSGPSPGIRCCLF
jgi:hypothetical protein